MRISLKWKAICLSKKELSPCLVIGGCVILNIWMLAGYFIAVQMWLATDTMLLLAAIVVGIAVPAILMLGVIDKIVNNHPFLLIFWLLAGLCGLSLSIYPPNTLWFIPSIILGLIPPIILIIVRLSMTILDRGPQSGGLNKILLPTWTPLHRITANSETTESPPAVTTDKNNRDDFD
jgi:hypothetical protein